MNYAIETLRIEERKALMKGTLYKCTACGRVGTVGRCCGLETRTPLNEMAKEEQRKLSFS